MEKYFLGFALFPGIGAVTVKKLLLAFGSASSAWEASFEDLEKILGKKTHAFIRFRQSINLEKEHATLQQKKITFLSQQDKQFPTLLSQLDSPPIGIFVKGDTSVLSSDKTIGIVGTRKVTAYGKEVTEKLTQEFVDRGFVVVSGLALGVDSIAHKMTLDCHGKTIAVLGSGVDICVPSSHQYLYDKIIAHGGCVVSTFPPGHQSNKGLFPARNALIAGLSLGIIVTEGTSDSGALITAEYAEKMNRPVFAVPGPITSKLSQATFSLLKKGAFPVSGASEALDRLGILDTPKIKKEQSDESLSDEEKAILSLLENGPLLFDEIVRKIQGDSKNIGSLLSLMELKGCITSSNGIYSI